MTTGARPPIVRKLGLQVALAMLAGLLLGLAARQIGPIGQNGDPNILTQILGILGNIFVQLLKLIVPSLVVTAIIASIANIRALANPGRLVGQTLLWFAITAALSVAIGLALGLLLQPGLHSGVTAEVASAPKSVGGWLDFLKGLVPGNTLGLTASTKIGEDGATTSLSFNVLQLVVLAILIGAAAVRTGEKAEPFLAWNAAFLAIVRTLLRWIIRLTPLGTIGLFGTAVATYGWSALASLGWFAGAVYLGLALVLLGLYPVLLALNGLDPRVFFRKAWPAIQLGFVTRSSIGTLPVTELATETLGVKREYAAFVAPLAATTKMDGCASIYPAIAALFIAQFYGLPLGIGDYALIAFVSVLGSAATAGLTGAIVMLTLTLTTLGLPLEGVGLLLAIDPILDMGRTATNVAGQVLVGTIVAKREGLLDADRYAADVAPTALAL
ncbi:dicarboxylate/amino acid:cation symporter [Sphingobium algorifonticola]|uniref:Dicarboxylate/amino acid:cation symporter n=1 Tax=Sphingobium algorifonticola TaxID=2008318 RepID=A0A437J9T9_9SPHN|nr:dicarboxylate/amino acid:cation symporter [Sphingobium algorifonticola]RVT42261.1 dicarboxylate/amino acid:cation symporter [Sphingobium algorifonticola]